ncbi:MAG: 4-hydroxythreonine-4-phosphate dehydrogenase PdxA [Phycisphaerales bacterium]
MKSNGQDKPTVAVTMGDPAGIGAEVIVKALADAERRQRADFIVYGVNEALVDAADRAGITPFWWRVGAGGDARRALEQRGVVVVDFDRFTEETARRRSRPAPSAEGGEASLEFISAAIEAAQLPAGEAPGRADAVVTAPISKTSWRLAGLKRYPGHTELFADRTRTKRYAMMFVAPRLRVVLATIHLPLMEIRNTLTIGRVFEPIDLGDRACRESLGVAQPRIAVCGLNPHASEGGLFGDEEERLIRPAIAMAQEAGIDAKGPFPADTIFHHAVEGRYDLVVAMYHDQGLIPIKLLAFDSAVNCTIGLPFVRTSPDHGTAFDIAGENRAHPGSMAASLDLAVEMTERRRAFAEAANRA